jgi:hypothetical protein
MENQNNQLLLLMRIVSSWYQKNICSEFTHLHIYTFNVLVDHHDPPQPWTLLEV